MDSGRGMVVIFIDGPGGSNEGLSAKEQLGILSVCLSLPIQHRVHNLFSTCLVTQINNLGRR